MTHALQTMCCRAHWGACRRGRAPARGRRPQRSRSSPFCWVRGMAAVTLAPAFCAYLHDPPFRRHAWLSMPTTVLGGMQIELMRC